MTNEEVIQELKSRKLTMSMCIDIESCISTNNAIDIAINSIQENTKLKAEIEQLNRIISENIDKHECYVVSKSIEVNNLKVENNQLKSELEQSIKLPCKVGDVVYLLDFDENKYDEAAVEEIVITKNGKIEINSDYEIGTWSEDTYIKYSLKEAEQSLKCEVSND